MKFIYGCFKILLGIGMMTLGVLLIPYQIDEIYPVIDKYYEQVLEEIPPEIPVREIGAGLILFVGVMVIASMFSGPRRNRTISFAGMHGEVTIELDDVEKTLERVATKLPEVRSAAIRLEPTDSAGRVRVIAKVILLKNADDEARMVTARVQHYIQIHTRKILGLNDVDVQLNVKKFHMNMKTVKPDPLMLEGPVAEAMAAAMAPNGADIPVAAPDADVVDVVAAVESEEDEADRG